MKRIENKFDISNYTNYQIINQFKLKKLYPRRKIISTYYDSENFLFFNSTIEGLRPRIKIRVRNYNDQQRFFLEFKYTEIFGKRKKTFLLENFQEKDKRNINTLNYVKSNVSFRIKPTLTVNYLRDYYFNNLGRFTIDTNIQFKKKFDTSKIYRKEHYQKKILEFKSEKPENEKLFNQNFTLKEHSFSKYCEGISLLYGFSS